MKKSRIAIWFGVVLLGMITSASAQTGAIRIAIPFDFTMGKQAMTAGTYKVAVNGSLLQVARVDGPDSASVMTSLTGGGPGQTLTPRLLFHRYNSQYFLAIAWIGEINQGHELYASAAELELARNTKQEQRVVLAVSRR